MSNDDVIVDEIRAALEQDPRLPHPAEVAVSEEAGTVTLRGHRRQPGSASKPGGSDRQDGARGT